MEGLVHIKEGLISREEINKFLNILKYGNNSQITCFIKNKLQNVKSETLLNDQKIFVDDEIPFHIHNIFKEITAIVFLVLELKLDNKTRFITYMYVNSDNLGQMEKEFVDMCHPTNTWRKVFSFEQTLIDDYFNSRKYFI